MIMLSTYREVLATLPADTVAAQPPELVESGDNIVSFNLGVIADATTICWLCETPQLAAQLAMSGLAPVANVTWRSAAEATLSAPSGLTLHALAGQLLSGGAIREMPRLSDSLAWRLRLRIARLASRLADGWRLLRTRPATPPSVADTAMLSARLGIANLVLGISKDLYPLDSVFALSDEQLVRVGLEAGRYTRLVGGALNTNTPMSWGHQPPPTPPNAASGGLSTGLYL